MAVGRCEVCKKEMLTADAGWLDSKRREKTGFAMMEKMVVML
jgi:hypothetical protein